MLYSEFEAYKARFQNAEELKLTADLLKTLANDVEHSDGLILRPVNPNRRGQVFEFSRLPGFSEALKHFLDEQHRISSCRFTEF